MWNWSVEINRKSATQKRNVFIKWKLLNWTVMMTDCSKRGGDLQAHLSANIDSWTLLLQKLFRKWERQKLCSKRIDGANKWKNLSEIFSEPINWSETIEPNLLFDFSELHRCHFLLKQCLKAGNLGLLCFTALTVKLHHRLLFPRKIHRLALPFPVPFKNSSLFSACVLKGPRITLWGNGNCSLKWCHFIMRNTLWKTEQHLNILKFTLSHYLMNPL